MMSVLAAFIYWVIVTLWLAVLATICIAYVRNPRTFGTARLLLAVLTIDTTRNIIENTYFGLYFGAQYGLFPSEMIGVLGKPHLLIIPKIINVVAALTVIGLLLWGWLPKAAKERAEAEDAARTARDRLFDAIESLNDTFRLFDSDGRLLICNGRYREMHPAAAALAAPGVSYETLLCADLRESDGSHGQTGPADMEDTLQRYRSADGSPAIRRLGDTWLMSRVRRTRDGAILVIETDITELKRVDVAKDELIATVSHELRTPLTSIRGALAALGVDGVTSQPNNRGKMLALAERNCTRLMRIVDDLLDVAKIAADGMKLDLQSVSLAALLQQTVEQRGSSAPNVRLVVSDCTRNVQLIADPLRIQQAIDNLISNAAKFSNEGSPIDLTLDRHEEFLRVSVKDNGVGIPESFHGRLFEAFTQANSSSTRLKGGAGLGLHLVKKIVDAHFGKIGFASTEGRGALFYIDLPLAMPVIENPAICELLA
jgi:signal transduction histidine kinase